VVVFSGGPDPVGGCGGGAGHLQGPSVVLDGAHGWNTTDVSGFLPSLMPPPGGVRVGAGAGGSAHCWVLKGQPRSPGTASPRLWGVGFRGLVVSLGGFEAWAHIASLPWFPGSGSSP
jgi:hypothetical protein